MCAKVYLTQKSSRIALSASGYCVQKITWPLNQWFKCQPSSYDNYMFLFRPWKNNSRNVDAGVKPFPPPFRLSANTAQQYWHPPFFHHLSLSSLSVSLPVLAGMQGSRVRAIPTTVKRVELLFTLKIFLHLLSCLAFSLFFIQNFITWNVLYNLVAVT